MKNGPFALVATVSAAAATMSTTCTVSREAIHVVGRV